MYKHWAGDLMSLKCPNCGAPVEAVGKECSYCHEIFRPVTPLSASVERPAVVAQIFRGRTGNPPGRSGWGGRGSGRSGAGRAAFSVRIIPGGVAVTGLSGSCSTLAVPSLIEGKPVLEIGEGAFRNRKDILEVALPDCVECVADRAFEGCASLHSVSCGEGLLRIGDGAFRNCTQLTSVRLCSEPDAYYSSFAGCYALGTLIESRLRLEEH